MSNRTALHKALAQCIEQRTTFAAFRLPGQHVQLWAQRQPELETIDGALLLELNQVFLLAPFRIDPERIPFIRADIELTFAEIDPDIALLDSCTGSAPDISTAPTSTTKADHVIAVTAAKEACRQGLLEKVVISRIERLDLDPTSTVDRYQRMLAEAPDAFVVLTYTPDHGLWMGASPERLVHADEGHVTVDALAGTWPVERAPASAGAAGSKELEEQGLVARAVMRTFVAQDLRNITTHGPNMQAAGPVAHLHTVLEADLGDRLLGDLVLALHPTPAVGGTPTAEALAFIRKVERYDRQLYTGFWGPWNADGITDLYVNLRCLRIHRDGAGIFVGGGITADSDPLAEWEETVQKAQRWNAPATTLG